MRCGRGTLIVGGLAGLASFLADPAHADQKGVEILRAAFKKLHEAKSLTAELTSEREMTGRPTETWKGQVVLQKPNLISVTLVKQGSTPDQKTTYVSDGKNYFTFQDGTKTYMRSATPTQPESFGGEWEGEIDSFFGGEKNAEKLTADYAGTETIDGKVCDLVRVTRQGDVRVLTYAIGKDDHLIYRSSWTAQVDNKTRITQTNRLRNIKVNGSVKSDLFAFTPPAGAKLYDPAEEFRKMEEKLVKVGEEAPAFELTNPKDKTRFSLAKVSDGRKAVLVNFWFYG